MDQQDKMQINKEQTDKLSMQSALAKALSKRDKGSEKTLTSLATTMAIMSSTMTNLNKQIDANTKTLMSVGKFLAKGEKQERTQRKKLATVAQEAKRAKKLDQQSEDIADIAKLMEENNRLTKKAAKKTGGWFGFLMDNIGTLAAITGAGLIGFLLWGEKGNLKKLWDSAKTIGGGFFKFLLTGDTSILRESWDKMKGTLPQDGVLGWIFTGKAWDFSKSAFAGIRDTGGLIYGILTGDWDRITKNFSELHDRLGTGGMIGAGLLGFLLTGNMGLVTGLAGGITKILVGGIKTAIGLATGHKVPPGTGGGAVSTAIKVGSKVAAGGALQTAATVALPVAGMIGAGIYAHRKEMRKFAESGNASLEQLRELEAAGYLKAGEAEGIYAAQQATTMSLQDNAMKARGIDASKYTGPKLPESAFAGMTPMPAQESTDLPFDLHPSWNPDLVTIAKERPDTLGRFANMALAYSKVYPGKRLQVNSAFRSLEEQTRLYNEDPSKAAQPGFSFHNYGLAFDINSSQVRELKKANLLDRFGFWHPTQVGEGWHIEDKATKSAGSRLQTLENLSGKKVEAKNMTVDSPGRGDPNMPQMRVTPKISSSDMEVNLSPESIKALAQGIVNANKGMMMGMMGGSRGPKNIITTNGRS